jgi:phosphoenolpyruvate synthase/pyruvate phosphate dikinase
LLLTPQEAAAVSCLRKDGGEQMVEVDVPGEHEDARSVYNAEIYKKKERAEERYGDYHKADFVLGSAAEIERVWSSAEKILTPARFSTHPISTRGHSSS